MDRFASPCGSGSGGGQPWKLIQFFDTGRKELNNLAEDISEQNDLADKDPQKVAELHELLAAWRKDVGAKIPGGPRGFYG